MLSFEKLSSQHHRRRCRVTAAIVVVVAAAVGVVVNRHAPQARFEFDLVLNCTYSSVGRDTRETIITVVDSLRVTLMNMTTTIRL